MSNPMLKRMDSMIHRAMRATGVACTASYAGGGQTLAGARVYVDNALQLMGEFGETSGPRTAVAILREDVASPVQWATVTLEDGTVFSLESEISRDESISRWVVSRE